MHLCKCLIEFNKLKKCVTKLVTLIFSWKESVCSVDVQPLTFIDARGEVVG